MAIIEVLTEWMKDIADRAADHDTAQMTLCASGSVWCMTDNALRILHASILQQSPKPKHPNVYSFDPPRQGCE
jgi:hypothetical protein